MKLSEVSFHQKTSTVQVGTSTGLPRNWGLDCWSLAAHLPGPLWQYAEQMVAVNSGLSRVSHQRMSTVEKLANHVQTLTSSSCVWSWSLLLTGENWSEFVVKYFSFRTSECFRNGKEHTGCVMLCCTITHCAAFWRKSLFGVIAESAVLSQMISYKWIRSLTHNMPRTFF